MPGTALGTGRQGGVIQDQHGQANSGARLPVWSGAGNLACLRLSPDLHRGGDKSCCLVGLCDHQMGEEMPGVLSVV